MKTEDAFAYLNSFIDYEKNLAAVDNRAFKLDRMRALCKALGNPEKDLKVIHIAGSKGKGSTSAMLAHVLKEAHLRVGLYTSPHINHFRERIRILDRQDKRCSANDIFTDNISEKEFTALVKKYKPVIEEIRNTKEYGRLTFYEVLTALSFIFFKEQKCHWVILETGLGGRLDATNVCEAKLVIITPISLEHTHILGDTIQQIAKEKSGIIKGNEEVVVACQKDEAEQVIRNRCFEFDIDVRTIELEGDEASLVQHILRRKFPLKGAHQANNALTVLEATAALSDLGVQLDEDDVVEGLKKVYWPLRFEQISNKPVVILDAAHDVASMEALTKTLEEEFPDHRVRCLFGVSEDKNREAIAAVIDKMADMIVVTKADHPRAHTFAPEEVDAYFPNKAHFLIHPVRKALDFILSTAADDELILITGSMFLAAEARREFPQCINTKA